MFKYVEVVFQTLNGGGIRYESFLSELRRIVQVTGNTGARSNYPIMNRYKSPLDQLFQLAAGVWRNPAGRGQLSLAISYGLLCHIVFSLAVFAMIAAMFFGMSESLGRVPVPWSYVANLALIVQFPITHSVLLSVSGKRFLEKLCPAPHGKTLATTTFAIIASCQLFALFALWTPSGIIWWQAEGAMFAVLCCLYGASWLLLIKASYDAGAEVQSGALGWMSLAQNTKPVFPDMPTRGLFRFIRQPIYVAFTLTLWTVPVWTPDQLVLAVTLTAYCLSAPRFKERRFRKMYGKRFNDYAAQTPYIIPRHWRN